MICVYCIYCIHYLCVSLYGPGAPSSGLLQGFQGFTERPKAVTPSPPTKSSGFGGFDSSRLLILKGGNSHVRFIL